MSVIKESTTLNDLEQHIKNNDLVCVYFWAPWCGPCQSFAPIFAEYAGEAGDKVSFVKVDLDKNVEAGTKFQIKSIPTLLLFQKGELKNIQKGRLSKDELASFIEC